MSHIIDLLEEYVFRFLHDSIGGFPNKTQECKKLIRVRFAKFLNNSCCYLQRFWCRVCSKAHCLQVFLPSNCPFGSMKFFLREPIADPLVPYRANVTLQDFAIKVLFWHLAVFVLRLAFFTPLSLRRCPTLHPLDVKISF